jgi:hypothetical protein
MFTGAPGSAQDTCAPKAHSRVLRRMWALGLLLAAASPVQAQTPNDDSPPPSPWTRDTLGGDWGGFRDALGQQGIRFDLWATGFYQDMLKGRGNDDGGFGGRADLLINGDTGKLGLWQGGGLHAHLTYRGDDLPGFRGGALLPVHTSGLLPVDGENEVVATSLYVSQRLGDATRVVLGKINVIDLLASHPFFGGWGTDRFWNVAFVAPPTGVLPPVIMGGILTYSFAPYTLTAMVFDPNDQTTNYSLRHLFADGVNVSLGLARSGEIAGRKSGIADDQEKGFVQRRGRTLSLARGERRRARQGPRRVCQGCDRRRQPEPGQGFIRRGCRRPCDRPRATARLLRRRLLLLQFQQ